MVKIRTLSHLQTALDFEFSWRIKEISDFKTAAAGRENSARTFVRAGVTLVYAHWEGFIKGASELYLNFIENQNLLYRELKTCFAVFGLKGQLAILSVSRKAKANMDAFDFLISEMDKRAKMTMSSAIDTESNLASPVFANIAASLDIDTSRYETRFNLIDSSLVSRRNKIAHGEYLDLDFRDFRTLADDVLQLMRDYKTDIENAATQQTYKRTSPGGP